MPSEYGHGFGIVFEEDDYFETIVCKDIIRNKNNVTCTFYPDITGLPANISNTLTVQEWDEISQNGVMVGPLKVFESPESGVMIEICGAWHLDMDEISDEKFLDCLYWISQLKEQGRIPCETKLSSYSWC